MGAKVAVVGAGVTGLTCAIVLAENGYSPQIFAAEPAEKRTSGAAAAIWYPYEALPQESALAWGMITYGRLLPLSLDTETTGVSLIEFRFFSKEETLLPDSWATALSFRYLERAELLPAYNSGYAMRVPLMDTSRYLPYLRTRLPQETLHYGIELERLEDVDQDFDLIVNCTGYQARSLVGDRDLVGHRGQIALVERLPAPGLPYAFVCTEKPLTYVIPRSEDCVVGGWNDESTIDVVDPNITESILAEGSRVLGTIAGDGLALIEPRVGLRPYRTTGVRVETELLRDGRRVVHNYGHAGAGFSLSWGCAHKVAEFVRLHLQSG